MEGIVLDIPIYNKLIKYSRSKPTVFHMPGHKLGEGIPKELLDNLTKIDLTEIEGTDNLHYPEGIIKEAQELAAKAFGAKKTFFLVNGSTCGIHAMIMSTCKKGDKLIVARDCHKSVINAMIMVGVNPVYIKPRYNKEFDISTIINIKDIENAIKQNPEAVGVFLTRPNYYGLCCDIEKISQIVHSNDKILMVDEAHGSHLKFSNKLPISALEAGCDLSVQSAHKTLPALTQGAYLHIGSNSINIGRLEQVLRMIQTSSPSYIIMAFLDIAREIMDTEGEKRINLLLDYLCEFNNRLSRLQNLKIIDEANLKECALDKTRLTINFKSIGLTGFEACTILRKKYNIQVEMADMSNVVCIATISDRRESFENLISALNDIHSSCKGKKILADIHSVDLNIPIQGIELSEIFTCESLKINLKDAVGRISKDLITPYPPGIPVICPGEIFTNEVTQYLIEIVNSGGIVNGVESDFKVNVIK